MHVSITRVRLWVACARLTRPTTVTPVNAPRLDGEATHEGEEARGVPFSVTTHNPVAKHQDRRGHYPRRGLRRRTAPCAPSVARAEVPTASDDGLRGGVGVVVSSPLAPFSCRKTHLRSSFPLKMCHNLIVPDNRKNLDPQEKTRSQMNFPTAKGWHSEQGGPSIFL